MSGGAGGAATGGRPWAIAARGLALTVRVTPKGGRDAIEGITTLSDGRAVLKVRVRAAPDDGKANAALERLIAGTLGIAPRQVAVVSGATARVKGVAIDGDARELAAALERLTAPGRT